MAIQCIPADTNQKMELSFFPITIITQTLDSFCSSYLSSFYFDDTRFQMLSKRDRLLQHKSTKTLLFMLHTLHHLKVSNHENKCPLLLKDPNEQYLSPQKTHTYKIVIRRFRNSSLTALPITLNEVNVHQNKSILQATKESKQYSCNYLLIVK